MAPAQLYWSRTLFGPPSNWDCATANLNQVHKGKISFKGKHYLKATHLTDPGLDINAASVELTRLKGFYSLGKEDL